jgi:hypothetical protein
MIFERILLINHIIILKTKMVSMEKSKLCDALVEFKTILWHWNCVPEPFPLNLVSKNNLESESIKCTRMQPAAHPCPDSCLSNLLQADINLSFRYLLPNVPRARRCFKEGSRLAARRARPRRRGQARCTSARRSSPRAISTMCSTRTTTSTRTKSRRVSKSTRRVSTSRRHLTRAETPPSARSKRISSAAKDEFSWRPILTWNSFRFASQEL